MFLGKVVGNVVSTQKNERLIGSKLLLVRLIDESGEIIKGNAIVAVDNTGSGIGDTVLVVRGSNAGSIYDEKRIPADAAIVGIVDTIEVDELYR